MAFTRREEERKQSCRVAGVSRRREEECKQRETQDGASRPPRYYRQHMDLKRGFFPIEDLYPSINTRLLPSLTSSDGQMAISQEAGDGGESSVFLGEISSDFLQSRAQQKCRNMKRSKDRSRVGRTVAWMADENLSSWLSELL